MGFDNILIIHLAGIGDLLMGRWALARVRQTHPHSRISLLTWTRNLEAAQLMADIAERYGLDPGSSWRAITHNLRTAAQLRAQRFDAAINCYQVYRHRGVLKLALLLGLIGARRTAGRNTDGKGWCFTQRIPERFRDPLHEVERQSRFVERLGCRPVPGASPLAITVADQQAADAWLSRQGATAQTQLVALHPGGARAGHRWPVASFAQLGQALEPRDNRRVVIIGGPAERALAEEIAGRLRAPVVAAGQLSFGQLAHLLRRCRLLVTNDSGPMHLAAALNVPLVAIFGPGDPDRYGPYPLDRSRQVILHATGDPPCFQSRCKGHAPLAQLPVQRVLDVAEALLSGQDQPAGIQRIAPAAP